MLCVRLSGAYDAAEAPDVLRETVFEWFKEEARRVWRNADFVLSVTELDLTQQPRAGVLAALGRVGGKPQASGDSIFRRAQGYGLMISDELLTKSPEQIRRVLIHEAVHLGISGHGRDFREMVRRHGGAVSETGLDSDNEIQIQKKIGSRYQTVRKFPADQEREAFFWAKQQAHAAPGSRWRALQGYDEVVGV